MLDRLGLLAIDLDAELPRGRIERRVDTSEHGLLLRARDHLLVTGVEPVGDFWEAEPEHQDYLERIPNGYTCHYVRPNWKLPKTGK